MWRAKTWLDKLIELKVMSTPVRLGAERSGDHRHPGKRLPLPPPHRTPARTPARARRVSIAALTECGVTRRTPTAKACSWVNCPTACTPTPSPVAPPDAGILFAPGTHLPSGGGNNAHAAYASDLAVLACLGRGWTHWGEAVAGWHALAGKVGGI